MKSFKTGLMASAVATLAWAAPAFAQTAPHADPADPALLIPALRHESVLRGYRPFTEQKPDRWRAVNEAMGTLGGHRGHAKDAPSASPAAAPPSAGAAPAAPAPPDRANVPRPAHQH